jgi:hypothetical protein
MDVRRMVAASTAIFLAGIGISAAIYFSSRPLHFNDAVISNFLSPADDPLGYLAASVGTVVAGFLLAPAAVIFYRRLSAIHRWGSITGAALFGTGLAAAIALGSLAPVPAIDFSLHLFLAYAAFMSLQAAVSVYLTVAAYGSRSRRLAAFAAAEWILGILLFCVSFGPDWPGSVAFCEWGLFATIAAGLLVLANWCS